MVITPERNASVADVSGAVEHIRKVIAFADEHGFPTSDFCPIAALVERINGGAGQIVGRVQADADGNSYVVLNGLGNQLPDGTPIYSGVKR